MRRKTVSGIMLSLLLIGMLILIVNIQPVKAESLPYLSVEPPLSEISAGQSVNINVEVHNVTDLYGFDFQLTYNDTLLEYVGYTMEGTGQVVTTGAYTPTDVSVPGTVKLGCAFSEYAGAVPFNGTGVLAWITFKGLTEGVSNLTFVESWTYLYDPVPNTIPRDPCVPGEITVGPGYTLTIHSSPTGVTFTVDGMPHTTPWSGTYSEGASVSLVMPQTHDGYVWSRWLEDGDTNRIKTVTMDTDITLTAVYTPPRPVGGKATPINIPMNKPETPILWIWLSTNILSLAVTVVYVKKRKRHTEINS